jgi:hypothetical protein
MTYSIINHTKHLEIALKRLHIDINNIYKQKRVSENDTLLMVI